MSDYERVLNASMADMRRRRAREVASRLSDEADHLEEFGRKLTCGTASSESLDRMTALADRLAALRQEFA